MFSSPRPVFFFVAKVYKKPSHLRRGLDFVFSCAEARRAFPKGTASPIYPSANADHRLKTLEVNCAARSEPLLRNTQA